jgi:hypothetical protein
VDGHSNPYRILFVLPSYCILFVLPYSMQQDSAAVYRVTRREVLWQVSALAGTSLLATACQPAPSSTSPSLAGKSDAVTLPSYVAFTSGPRPDIPAASPNLSIPRSHSRNHGRPDRGA